MPVLENGRLIVHRHRQLQGTGYLVLTSAPAANLLTEGTGLVPALPTAIEVRARYLAVASSIAAEARPLPESAWARVDLEDLPASLSEALEVIDLAAAWRLTDQGSAAVARLAVKALAPAPSLDEPVRRRVTTTLLTMEDALLHRDLFTLGPVTRPGAALDVVLPAGAKLWSAKVGDQPVRPLERGGRISVPLGFTAGAETVVEVVSVLEKALPKGRSELGIELPQVALPVLEHRWRVLLPEVNRYRFREGTLRPARMSARDPWTTLHTSPGVLTDRINVGGNGVAITDQAAITEDVITVTAESGKAATGATVGATELEKIPTARDPYFDFDSFEEMRQGFVGGVRPLNVAIPETGKALYLAGVLPPTQVSLKLDVRAKK